MDFVYSALGLVQSFDAELKPILALLLLFPSVLACLYFEGNLVSRLVKAKYVSTICSDKGLTLETPAVNLLTVANLR